ncbi:MAG: lamin tail domain-containing protein [Myxococcota bacterium]
MKTGTYLASAVFGLGALVGSACTDPFVQDPVCEPGGFVFCRCPNGDAGTKECRADGLSFRACRLSDTLACSGGTPAAQSSRGGGRPVGDGGFGGTPSPDEGGARPQPEVVPWVNELHYDNDGTDEGEGVEIAGAAGTDLSGWSVVFYNGSTGTLYSLTLLSGRLPDEQNGYGALWFPQSGLQNGSNDGLALVDGAGELRSFLSYEGAFTATDGPAAGQVAADIGVSQGEENPVGWSLQRTGTGTEAADFSWQGPAEASPGMLNEGQIIDRPQ